MPLTLIANETVFDEPDQIDAVPEHDPALDPELLPDDEKIQAQLDAYEDDGLDDLDDLDELTDDDIADAIADLTLGDMMELEEDEPEDYVEETTTADGHHIRKEVHQGAGFKSVRITSDGGAPAGGDIPDEIK